MAPLNALHFHTMEIGAQLGRNCQRGKSGGLAGRSEFDPEMSLSRHQAVVNLNHAGDVLHEGLQFRGGLLQDGFVLVQQDIRDIRPCARRCTPEFNPVQVCNRA